MRLDSLRLAALSLFVLTSTACASLRPAVGAPVPTLPAAFGHAEGLSSGPPAGGAWWERFGDAELSRLVTRAFEANRDLRAQLEAVEAARAVRGLRQAERLPSGGVRAVHEERRRTSGEAGEGARRTDFRSAGLEASWELDLFGRLRNESRAAGERLQATQALYEQARLVLAAEVVDTWFGARGAEARIAARRDVSDDQRRLVELVEARVQAGRVPADTLARARAELAATEADLVAERERLVRLTHALAVLVAEMPGSFTLPPAPALGPLTLAPIAVGDPGRLLRQRPDVRAAEHGLRAQQIDVGAASAGFFPQLSLRGFFGLAAGGGVGLGDAGTGTWSAGPVLSWGLFDLGRVKARVRAEQAEARAALAQYEATVLRALEEAENAFFAFGSAHDQLRARQEQASYAALAAGAARARYEEGAGDYLEVLLARRDATTAELSRIDGLVAHRAATVAVLKALGAVPEGAL